MEIRSLTCPYVMSDLYLMFDWLYVADFRLCGARACTDVATIYVDKEGLDVVDGKTVFTVPVR